MTPYWDKLALPTGTLEFMNKVFLSKGKPHLNGCIRTNPSSDYRVFSNHCENSETGTTAWTCNGKSSFSSEFPGSYSSESQLLQCFFLFPPQPLHVNPLICLAGGLLFSNNYSVLYKLVETCPTSILKMDFFQVWNLVWSSLIGKPN